jgi:hypothetical protein
MWVAWIFIVLAVIAALSAGMALGLHLLKPDWSERRRVLWSGTIAALLPMSVAFGGFFYGAEDVLSGGGEDFVIGLMALLALQVMLWAIICLPPAWLVTSRLSTGHSAPALGAPEDPDLLAG